jgi:holo-[acyl-carrier protein] synthase
MSKAVGIDIVEIEAIKDKYSDRFVKRILSTQELERFNTITNLKRKLEYLAGRFAAKEAYSKVYKRFEDPLHFTDVSVLNDEHGAPYIVSTYRPQDRILVSISHSNNYVVAIVTLEE